MEEKIWAKTMLSMYKYIDVISDTIDSLVRRETVGSNNIYGISNTLDALNRVIKLNSRKATLINLKVLICEVKGKLADKYQRFIDYFYIEGFKPMEVANLMNVSIRTFYRLKDRTSLAFGRVLKCLGYDDKKLSSIFRDELWLKNALEYNNDPSMDADLASYKTLKFVSRELKGVA